MNKQQPRKSELAIQIDSVLTNNRSEPEIDLKRDMSLNGLGTDLLSEISKKMTDISRLSKMVQEIVKMTKNNLQASASSLLLLDEKEQELFFEVAEGKVGNRLKQVRFSIEHGIAGWVARHHKPLIVNNVAEDKRFNNTIDENRFHH